MKLLPIFLLATILLASPSGTWAQGSRSNEVGNAVYYADYLHGRKTANGEIYDRNQYTCAHKVHPFGTLLRVTRLDNSKSVLVRVNDRGPFGEGLVVDLSKTAAADIGLLRDGKTRVSIDVAGFSNNNPRPSAANRDLVSRSNASTRYNPNPYSNTPRSGNGRSNEQFTAKSGNTSYPNIYRSKSVTSDDALDFPTDYSGNSTNRTRFDRFDNNNSNRNTPTFSAPSRTTSTTTGTAIQLAAFTNVSNANRQLDAIRRQGLTDAYIVEKRVGGRTYQKIVIGPFANRPEAQTYLQNIKSRYRVSGFLVTL